MPRKRILILNSLYYPNIGGVENSIYELAKAYSNIGYEVDILCSNKNLVSTEALPKKTVDEFSNIYRFNVLNLGYVIQILNCLKAIKALVRSNSYDCIISRGYIPSFCLSLMGIKYIYLVPSVILFQDKNKKHTLKGRVKYLFSSLIQCISINTSENMVFSQGMIEQVEKVKLIKGKTKLGFFGVDRERFKPPTKQYKIEIRKSLGLDVNGIYLLCLGRFSEIKNFEVAIKSLRNLDSKYKLLLVGGGPQEEKYKELIKEEGIADRVHIFGPTNSPEVFYQASDLFLMTSRYEAFGQVLLEATACKLKVLAFRKGDNINTNTEFVYSEHPDLVIYPDGENECSLSKCILDNEVFIIQEMMVSNFLEKYSWERLAKKIVVMYLEDK